MQQASERIISVLLENVSGALSRVVSMFSARGFNIDSMTVSSTEDETLYRLTIVTCVNDHQQIEQLAKQMNKIIDVHEVIDLTDKPHLERELMLVKVRADTPELREEMKRLADIFRGRIDDVNANYYIVEITGNRSKLEAFLGALPNNAIIETARSGFVGMQRGSKNLKAKGV